MSIVDAHAHIGSFGSWAGVSATAEQLISQMDKFHVERAAVFGPDNGLVKRSVDLYPDRLLGYVWPNPQDAGALEVVRVALDEWHFRGVKLHPLLHAFLPTDEEVRPIVELAVSKKVPIAIHSGHPPFSLPWSIGELAEEHPKANIVMLHMGHAHGVYIKAAIDTAVKYGNITLETSGVSMHSKILEAVRRVGRERVVFGSDYPFHDYSVELQKVIVSGLDGQEQRMVLHDNAERMLGRW